MNMIIFDLPIEILTEIVCQCDNPAILETCKTFAAVTQSIPSLWTTVILRPCQFTIDGPHFLRVRILRTKGAMLTVCIGLTKRTKEVSALCKLLAEYNAQIRDSPSPRTQPFWRAVLSMMSFRTWRRSKRSRCFLSCQRASRITR